MKHYKKLKLNFAMFTVAKSIIFSEYHGNSSNNLCLVFSRHQSQEVLLVRIFVKLEVDSFLIY